MPSVLWRCWLGGRKGIRPVKNWVMGYWHGYLSGARCRWFACSPADTTATPIISCSSKIQNGLLFWCQLTQVVLEKRPLNGCSSSSLSSSILRKNAHWIATYLCRYRLTLNRTKSSGLVRYLVHMHISKQQFSAYLFTLARLVVDSDEWWMCAFQSNLNWLKPVCK